MGNVRTIVIRPTGIMRAPPQPWRIRAATSIGMSTERPHRREPSEKTPIAVKKTHRVPKRSAIQPLMGMKTARLIV